MVAPSRCSRKMDRVGRKRITGKGALLTSRISRISGDDCRIPGNGGTSSALRARSAGSHSVLKAAASLTKSRARGARLPASDRAEDAVGIDRLPLKRGVGAFATASVEDFSFRRKIAGVRLHGGAEIEAEAVSLGDGGATRTGSTGDGAAMATPSIISFPCSRPGALGSGGGLGEELSGLSLRNVTASLMVDGTLGEKAFGGCCLPALRCQRAHHHTLGRTIVHRFSAKAELLESETGVNG